MSKSTRIPFVALIIALFSCNHSQPEKELLPEPTIELFSDVLEELKLSETTQLQGAVVTPLKHNETEFKLGLQYFQSKNIIYMSINEYLWLDMSKNTASTAFTLTQLAILNHRVTGGKFQLNPTNGAITVGYEHYVANGVDRENLKIAIEKLISIAKINYETIKLSLGQVD